MLTDDVATVLPGIDPLTGDRLQLITRDEYFTIMGPIHMERFMRMASFHPQGDTSKPVEYDLEYFVGQFWPTDADIACIIRWGTQPHFVDQFINVTVYRRVNPSTVRTVMHIGESSDSNTVRTALYDVGVRHIRQEVRESRIPILQAMGAEHVGGKPNAHGRYEMRIELSSRPVPGRRTYPEGMNRGRR